jgi:transposase
MSQPKSQPESQRPNCKLLPEEQEQIQHLAQQRLGSRQIARRLGRDRKTIRRFLRDSGIRTSRPAAPCAASKLAPFHDAVRERVAQGLTASRILREIAGLGYAGGRTILAEFIARLRGPLAPRKKAKRRFETRPGLEMQVDWSIYTVPIAGILVRVHALLCVLAHSRKLHVRFYRDERETTLLEGLMLAFETFLGVALRLVVDNMATAVLGRLGSGRKVLWHPRFLEFCRYYGCKPFACKVADPDRKGKGERMFDFLEKDFIRGASFTSFDDLNARAQTWADTLANRRVHGTTGLVPDEAWLAERDFLIALPDRRFAVHHDSIREVGPDATLSIGGTLYTVPERLHDRSVAVRLYAEHFEVLDRDGSVACSRHYVEPRDKGKLQLDSRHYAHLPLPGALPSGRRIQEAFLLRFPQLELLVTGLVERVKTLAPIHLKALWRLADRYGDEAFLAAGLRALEYRRFSASSIARILERAHPLPEGQEPIAPVGAEARVLTLLGEVDSGSLDGYADLDRTAPTDSHLEPPKGDTDDEEK